MALHRLSAKGALVVAGAAGLAWTGASLTGGAWGWAVPVAAALGAAAYVAARRLTGERLEAVRALLHRLRAFDFEGLGEDEDGGGAPSGDAPAAEYDDDDDDRGSDDDARADVSLRRDEVDALLVEARRTGRVLADRMRELRKMENYRREFIGNVSHELKTPIFSIQGFAETLQGGALEDEDVRGSFVEKILHNADRLRHLARDLAEIARIETGELEMTVTTFPLGPLVEEVTESLGPVADEKEVALSERLPEGLPRVRGDRDRLRQVLSNLVDNAVKYNTEGGAVEVAARRMPGGDVKVYVVDDGVGVEPEHVERLTERFYRVDQSRSRQQGGTGLGLAIVKHILGAHGSKLSVSSSPGHGSTFGFVLAAASGSGSAGVRENGSGDKPAQRGERETSPANDEREITPR
ncbi:MAG: histidine kinase [Bacteroidetes bacterium QS_8_68_15]|nr:MAG: histidine kinase [Bacteroidetes bacterium QS_8_68_15]